MDPVDSLSRILALLRHQLGATDQRRVARRGATRPGRLAQGPAKSSVAELRQAVTARVRALEQTDPEWQRNAGHVLVASVLSWEFGEELLLDPRFSELSRDVLDAMLADPQLKASMEKLVRELS